MNNLKGKVKGFLDFLNYEQNVTTATIKTYRLILKQFFSWLESQNYNEFNHSVIHDFVKYLREERKNGANSIAQKLATLKSFFNYLSSLEINVPQIKTNYKRVKKVVSSLSTRELDLILNKALHGATGKTKRLHKKLASCYRDLVALLLLTATGLRASELCAINIKDLDLERGSIIITGNGQKQRQVYIDLPEIKEALARYLKLRHVLSPQDNALFLNQKHGKRLSVRGLEYIFEEYKAVVGGNKDVTPHIMRHTFASLSIEKGANIKAVSQILGHASVKTTLEMYTHLSEEYVRKVFQSCNPFTSKGLSLEEAVLARRQSLLYIDNPHQQSKYG